MKPTETLYDRFSRITSTKLILKKKGINICYICYVDNLIKSANYYKRLTYTSCLVALIIQFIILSNLDTESYTLQHDR